MHIFKSLYNIEEDFTKVVGMVDLNNSGNFEELFSSNFTKFEDSESPITNQLNIFLALCGRSTHECDLYINLYFPDAGSFNTKNYRDLNFSFSGFSFSEPYINKSVSGYLVEKDTDLNHTQSYLRVKTTYS